MEFALFLTIETLWRETVSLRNACHRGDAISSSGFSTDYKYYRLQYTIDYNILKLYMLWPLPRFGCWSRVCVLERTKELTSLWHWSNSLLLFVVSQRFQKISPVSEDPYVTRGILLNLSLCRWSSCLSDLLVLRRLRYVRQSFSLHLPDPVPFNSAPVYVQPWMSENTIPVEDTDNERPGLKYGRVSLR